MSMDELVLAKLVELARNPTHQQLEVLRMEAATLRRDSERMQKELLQNRAADGPLTELWQAAEALLKATPKTKRPAHELAHYERLHAALKTASPFVDQIPF